MDDNSTNIDQALLRAYLSTDYRLLNTSIVIKIDTLNPDLDSFLIDNNAYSWVFISAENPGSIRLKPKENQQNYLKLLKIAQKRAYDYWEGIGEGKDGEWPPEQSLLILDRSQTEIQELAQLFGQNAVVIGQLNQKSRLLWTNAK